MILELKLIMIASKGKGFDSWVKLNLVFEKCTPVNMIKIVRVKSR